MRHAPPPRLRPHERLRVTPVTLRAARAYVGAHHRHLPEPAGGKFALAVSDARGRLRGVAIAGRPVARRDDDGVTIEVTRVATDGCANACSMLYGATRRAARALGYERLLTYTRIDEPGTSLRAAGWRFDRITRGGTWSRTARLRRRGRAEGPKRRWFLPLTSAPDA